MFKYRNFILHLQHMIYMFVTMLISGTFCVVRKLDLVQAKLIKKLVLILLLFFFFSHIDEYVENVVLQKTFKNSHTHYLTYLSSSVFILFRNN